MKRAIAPLPTTTRRAMLVGVNANPIIAGAYVSRFGGICPMLAAHRLGAESDGGDFARAWDAFTGARWPRPARERELELLATLLQESLDRETGAGPAPSTPSNGHGPAPGVNGKHGLNGRPALNGSNGRSATNGASANGAPAPNGQPSPRTQPVQPDSD